MSALLASVPTAGPFWRLSVERYHVMIDSGVLTPDDHVELLDGILFEKMSKNPAHRIATRKLRKAIESIVPAGFYVDEQEPITLAESEPEPDVAVIRGNDSDEYHDRHPGPADVLLVCEVADTSLERDRNLTRRIYARAAIPTYWILNLEARKLEIYSAPLDGDYSNLRTLHPDDSATLTVNNVTTAPILVSALLP